MFYMKKNSIFTSIRAKLCMAVMLFVCLVGVSMAQEDSALINEEGYRIKQADESEFDNYSDAFVRDWREADPDYEDTEFGEFMYNEASTPTKLEMLRLMSKGTPSLTVTLHAVSMGIDIENMLQAAVNYDVDGSGSSLASSAVSVLPVLAEAKEYRYAGYELIDLERETESEPYKVQEVIDRFFEERSVLRPYPDWFEGQYHFLASAKELDNLLEDKKESKWYRSKSNEPVEKRPVFVSLYESSGAVLVDGEDRIKEALIQDPNALLPVVFVFNRLRERSLDQLNYPKTLRGVQQAYAEKSLMLTPVPEWQLGEYHSYIDIAEFYEIFDIPEEEDFEPEAWQSLLEEAENYSVTGTSFLVTVVGAGPESSEKQRKKDEDYNQASLDFFANQYAAWDDPRTEGDFKYVVPGESSSVTLDNIMGKGLIFNRPDLMAALNALGVKKVPVAFYYVDSARVKPYVKGKRVLLQSVRGVILRPSVPVGNGGFTPCASPPCIEQ